MPRTEEEIQKEIDNLDVPILLVTDALQLVGDYLDIPVLALLRRFDGEGLDGPLYSGEQLLIDLLNCALESSTQLPHIIRAIELDEEISKL